MASHAKRSRNSLETETRFVAEHFREDGKPKQPFKTEQEALAFDTMNDMHVYQCSFCGKWHRAKNV